MFGHIFTGTLPIKDEQYYPREKIKKAVKTVIKYYNKTWLLKNLKIPIKSPKHYLDWENLIYQILIPYTLYDGLHKHFENSKDREDFENYYYLGKDFIGLDDIYTFFVSDEILNAAINTKMHTDILNEIDEYKDCGFLFILPFNKIFEGLIENENSNFDIRNEHISFLTFYKNKNSTKLAFGLGRRGTLGYTNLNTLTQNAKNYNLEETSKKYRISENKLKNISQRNIDTLRNLSTFLLFLIKNKPELITKDNTYTFKGFGKNSKPGYRNPSWIGKHYYIKSEGKVTSKCPHIRSGHFRKQKHGKNREKEKIIWVEPCFVNYKKE